MKKKNKKIRNSKKKIHLKGGNEMSFDVLKTFNAGNVSININLIDKNNVEILNLIKPDDIFHIQNLIQEQISYMLELYLETNQNSLSLDEDTKTLITKWDVKIYLQTQNKKFPFLCYITFNSELPLNFRELDIFTKIITESDFLPIELEIYNVTRDFNLLYDFSNIGNRTMNYSITKKEWEDEKEIECIFSNGLNSKPRSAMSCLTKFDCKKLSRKDQIDKIKKKYDTINNIKCVPKYSKFNFQNELLAQEKESSTWEFHVNKLCSSNNKINCIMGNNGCEWDKTNDKCIVNPDDFKKRKDIKYY